MPAKHTRYLARRGAGTALAGSRGGEAARQMIPLRPRKRPQRCISGYRGRVLELLLDTAHVCKLCPQLHTSSGACVTRGGAPRSFKGLSKGRGMPKLRSEHGHMGFLARALNHAAHPVKTGPRGGALQPASGILKLARLHDAGLRGVVASPRESSM